MVGPVQGDRTQNKGQIMSTTEASHKQLDNVHQELHKLQVENSKLLAQNSKENLEQPKGK